MIKRRDPTRPGFWYLSYCHPHPPLAPLQCYMDMYSNIDVDMPYCGEWAKQTEQLPLPIKGRQKQGRKLYKGPDSFERVKRFMPSARTLTISCVSLSVLYGKKAC